MWMDPRRTEEFRMLAVSSSPGFALNGDEAAEFARETVAGVVEFELRLTGAFKYRPVHVGGSRRLDVKALFSFPPKNFSSIPSNLWTHAWNIKCR